MPRITISLPFIAVLLCAFIGFAIQVQMTIGNSGGQIGLRINLGDLILPFAGLLIVGTILIRKTIMPRWIIPLRLFWPVALTCLLCFAMWNGHHITGTWSQWAIINKFVGWFVLMAYFSLGAWIVTNFGEDKIRILLKIFLLSCILIAAGHLVYIMLAEYGLIARHPHYQHTGLMGNRNAMGFIMVSALALLLTYKADDRLPISAPTYYCFIGFLPLIAFYNESRALWVTIPVIVLCAVALNGFKTLRMSLFVIITGLCSVFTLNHFDLLARHNVAHYKAFSQETPLGEQQLYSGDVQRIRVLSDSLEFWKAHPFEGIGLGSFLHLQDKKYPQPAPDFHFSIIDSSPLWVLTEMGLIGVMLMGGFYVTSLYALKRSGPRGSGDVAALRRGVILILLAFAVMSIFHELLYTRFVWLLLGMALAISREELESVRANP
jgi:hypothetical protein